MPKPCESVAVVNSTLRRGGIQLLTHPDGHLTAFAVAKFRGRGIPGGSERAPISTKLQS